MRYPDALPGSLEEGLPTKEEAKRAIEFAEQVFNYVYSEVGEK